MIWLPSPTKLDEGYVLIGEYLFIYLFVCDSHNSKTTQPILMIFGGMIGHNSRKKWLTFGQGQPKVKVKVKVNWPQFSR